MAKPVRILHKLTPRWTKTLLRSTALRIGLRWVDWEFRHDRIPPQRVFSLARFGWGNSAWDADEEYLRASCDLIRHSSSDILECGSGLSTIIYRLALRGTSLHLVALEHQREWFDRVNDELERIGGEAVQLIQAPLVRYGEFDWYDWPSTLHNRRFGIVICDGPPSTTLGGRYGLLPVAWDQLRSPVTILLDDASRDGEKQALRRWTSEYGAVWDDHEDGQFTLVTVPLREPAE